MSKSATSPQRAALGGRLGILAAAALFSTGGAAVKSASLSGWQVACFRAGIAAVALYLMLPAARRRPSRWTLLVAVGHAITMILFVLSNKLTTAASSIFLQSTAPLYVLLLGPWLLHERVKRRDLYFVALVAVGLCLMFIGLDPASATAPRPFLGNVLALAAGLFWGLTVMGLRSLSRTGDGGVESGSPAAATLWANAFACLACLPFALPLASNGIGAVDLAVVSFLGIFQIGLAYVFMTSGIRHVPAFETSLLLFLEPVLNPIWAWLVHHERPTALSLAGGAVILAATLMKTWIESTESARPPIPQGEPHGS
ncbi:MAG TPA: DMT family transporter [Thermoanaerobaculia bacterium]|nr:DMT family transporter [Thermoanaerobaculia bacterium]